MQIPFLLIPQVSDQSHSRNKELIKLVEDSRRQLSEEIYRSNCIEQQVSKGVEITIVMV